MGSDAMHWGRVTHDQTRKTVRMHPFVVAGTAFVAGAVPFSNFAARRRAGVDLREVGTGTVSGTSLYNVAGFGPLAVAGVCDVAKGAVGPLLAGRDHPVLGAIAGGLAVAGHNWSPFLSGAGGRGLSPAIGALLPRAWPGAAMLLGGMAAGRVVKQTGLGAFVAQCALVPALARMKGRDAALAGACVLAPMLLKRATGNEPPARRDARIYARRIVFDYDEPPSP
ncbi:MAG: rane protein [Actinomycetia bacterium]|nr:rane protein [Actinomycetes bacterium]